LQYLEALNKVITCKELILSVFTFMTG